MATDTWTTASSRFAPFAPFAPLAPLAHTPDLQGLAYGKLLRQHDQAMADLNIRRADLLEASHATRYDAFNRKIDALSTALGSLPDRLDARLGRLANAQTEQWRKLHDQL